MSTPIGCPSCYALGALKPVYHGASALLTLKELVRSYVILVEDGTR